jgi:putative membrane protein
MSDQTDKRTPDEGSAKSPSPSPAPMAGIRAEGRAATREIISILTTLFGFGWGRTGKTGKRTDDVSTGLAYQRTDLALDRNRLAAERTLMGWIRTALSMISFGFTIGKLGQVIDSVNMKGILGNPHMMSVETIAYFLVILGTLSLFGAALQYVHRMYKLKTMGLQNEFSIAFVVAILLTLVGGFALSALVTAL